MRDASPPDPADYEAALEMRAGGSLSAAEVSQLLGISPQEVDERHRAQALLAIRHEGEWTYPRAQFHGSDTIPGFAAVVQGLEVSGPWVTLEFLVTPDEALDGMTPRDALLKGGEMRYRVMTIVRGHHDGEGFA